MLLLKHLLKVLKSYLLLKLYFFDKIYIISKVITCNVSYFFRCLFCKEIYDNFVYELMSEDMLDYIILSIIASHNILLLEMSFFFLRINRQ